MKRIIFIILVVFGSQARISAQNGDEYLKFAYSYLADNNVESAKKAYSVYCTLSNQRDLKFEDMLEDVSWRNKCYVIDLSDTEVLVVQKIMPGQEPLQFEKAKELAATSNLGSFSDWRLPTVKEGEAIISHVPQEYRPIKEFWIANNSLSGAATVTISVKRTVTYSQYGKPKTELSWSESDCGKSMDSNGQSITYKVREYKDGRKVYYKDSKEIGRANPSCNYFIVRTFNK